MQIVFQTGLQFHRLMAIFRNMPRYRRLHFVVRINNMAGTMQIQKLTAKSSIFATIPLTLGLSCARMERSFIRVFSCATGGTTCSVTTPSKVTTLTELLEHKMATAWSRIDDQ